MIYLDFAATTPIRQEVLEAMCPWLTDNFANPSGSYCAAREARDAIEDARVAVAETIGAHYDEIFFTSGGSEANNWAIRGLYCIDNGGFALMSNIEHHSILNIRTRRKLIPVDRNGLVDLDALSRNISYDPPIISVMMVNNEIGTIEPVFQIGKICAMNDIFFHTDAVQAYGHLPIDVNDLPGLTSLSASGHKLGAPKGVGFLYLSRDAQQHYRSFIAGGEQERGLRGGTENVAAIVGLAKAAQLAHETMDSDHETLLDRHSYFRKKLHAALPDITLNGAALETAYRMPNNVNVCFAPYGVRGEQLLEILDWNNICASSGSACNTHSDEPSHVLKAIGLTDDEANSSLRFTMSADTTEEEIDHTVHVLYTAIKLLHT